MTDKEFTTAVFATLADIAASIDKHFALTNESPPDPERDRVVICALLQAASSLAVDDDPLKAIKLFTDLIVKEAENRVTEAEVLREETTN